MKYVILLGATFASFATLADTLSKSELTAAVRAQQVQIQSLSNDLELAKQEVTALRGEIERSEALIRTLERKQHDMYRDLDARLNQIGTNGTGSVSKNISERSDPKATIEFAKRQLEQGKTLKAIADLELLLQSPTLTANDQLTTHYWLGESYYQQGELLNARKHFEQVLALQLEDRKVANAKLKLAIIHKDLQEYPQAKAALQNIVREYPNETVSLLAKRLLGEISRN